MNMTHNFDITFEDDVRYLSVGETLHQRLHDNSPPILLLFNFDIFNTTIPISDEQVRKALWETVRNHKMLLSNVAVNEDGDYYFVSHQDVGPDWMPLEFLNVNDIHATWIDLAIKETRKGLDKGLLWKALWLKCGGEQYALLSIFHHGVMDGKGALDFVSMQFLPRLCTNIKDGEPSSEIPLPISLVKSSEEIFQGINCAVSKQQVTWYVKTMMNLLFWKHRNFGDGKPTIRTTDEKMTEQAVGYLVFTVNQEMTNHFVAKCKQHEVNVQSLMLLVLSSAIERTRVNFPTCRKLVKFVYPIDMRKFHSQLCASPVPSGSYFKAGTQNIHPFHLENNDDVSKMFQYAKKVNTKIKEQNTSRSSLDNVFASIMLCLLKKSDLSISEKMKAFGLDMASLSNLGRYCLPRTTNLGKEMPVELKEHYFSLTEVDKLILTTTTLNDEMLFCIAYDREWVNSEFAVLLRNNLMDIMKLCISESSEQ